MLQKMHQLTKGTSKQGGSADEHSPVHAYEVQDVSVYMARNKGAVVLQFTD